MATESQNQVVKWNSSSQIADPNVPRDDREALKMYEEALEKSTMAQSDSVTPDDRAELFYNVGNVRERLGMNGESAYRECLALKESHNEARNNLALLLMRRGAYVEAVSELKCTGLESCENQINLGVALECLGKTEEAIEQYEAAITQNPKDPRPLTNLGNALIKLDHIQRAFECHEKAAELGGDTDATLRFNLATSLEAIGQVQAAVAQYEAVLKLDPLCSSAHINLALALQDLDASTQKDRIAYHLETAVELIPNDLDAWLNLGDFRLESVDDNTMSIRALDAFEKACKTKEGQFSPEAYLGKASALSQLNQIQAAIDAAKHSIRLAAAQQHPSHPDEESATLIAAKNLLRDLLFELRDNLSSSA